MRAAAATSGPRLGNQDRNGARGSDREWKPARASAERGSFNGKTEALADSRQNAFRGITEMRNLRDVWTVDSQHYPGAHFATFPPHLIERCVIAGCPVGGVVLDPFVGAGTTGLVAKTHGRRFIGIELNAEYCEMARHL
jgi:DNA modification methylase